MSKSRSRGHVHLPCILCVNLKVILQQLPEWSPIEREICGVQEPAAVSFEDTQVANMRCK